MRALVPDPFAGLPLTFHSPRLGELARPSAAQAAMPVDIADCGNEFVLEAELPGFSREDISVRVHEGRLTIEAQRTRPEALDSDGSGNSSSLVPQGGAQRPEGWRWSRRERAAGSFRRSFVLPDTVDVAQITADVRHGVLRVVLPKQERVRPREIEVRVH